MSYFSDIDLASLHRSRLNERIQYKLSWFNRRQKYCIPVASKSVCKSDNATTEVQNIKPFANNNHKFNTNAKSTCQPINRVNEMKVSDMSSDCLAKNKTTVMNRQRKNGYTKNTCNKKKTLTSLNKSSNQLNHLDDSTTIANEIVYLRHNQSKIPSRTHEMNRLLVNNDSTFSKNCAHKRDKIETVSILNQSNERFTSSDPNVNPSKREHSVDSIAVNQTAQINDVMSNKRNMIPLAGANVDELVIVEQAKASIVEEDLELPHRKRSGTWP